MGRTVRRRLVNSDVRGPAHRRAMLLEDAWTMLKRDEGFRLMTVDVTDVRVSEPAAAGVDPVSTVTVPNAG